MPGKRKRKREPKRGRPSIGEGPSVTVAFKVPADVRERWQALAGEAGLSWSDWLRAAVEKEAKAAERRLR